MRKQIIFVTGTGTGVGKTFICSAICLAFAEAGKKVAYWKPVQSGADEGTDVDRVKDVCAERVRYVPAVYTFKLAASPNQAARHENLADVSLAVLSAASNEISGEDGEILVVEGAGGLLVPLNAQLETWVDFLRLQRWPVLVVSAAGIGTLNHSSLTLNECRRQDLNVLGLILNGKSHQDNFEDLQRIWANVAIHAFPELQDSSDYMRKYSTQLGLFVAAQLAKASEHALSVKLEKENILALDGARVWHPYTQHQTTGEPLVISKAKGVWLETVDGKRLLDGTSSWWVNTIGHGRPEIAEAIRHQQSTLDHVLFAGATHKSAVQLADKIVQLMGGHLARVFFSDNGSTAVEVALKIAYQKHVNEGNADRDLFLGIKGSYHGDTFGAMGVARDSGLHRKFQKLLFPSMFVAPALEDEDCDEKLAAAKEILAKYGSRIAAVIIEPLVQGAAGMIFHSAKWLQGFVALCREYSLPVIFDEVFTGLGRVGAPFAWQRAAVQPDIVCVAKALTGGNLPLALTVCKEEFFAAFLADDKGKALFHGHSYTANPISCAAALAAIDIFEKERLPERARWLEEEFGIWLRENARHLKIANGRALGGILAFEMAASGQQDYFNESLAEKACQAQSKGLWIRPLGNTFYFMPPLVINKSELTFALDIIRQLFS